MLDTPTAVFSDSVVMDGVSFHYTMINLFTSVCFLGSATPHVFYIHPVLVSPYRSDSCGDISSAQVKLSTSRPPHVKIVTLLKIHLVLCWIFEV